jgi:hypothetical protein
MEIYRPHTGEELKRRQFIRKLALGTAAIGTAVYFADDILETRKKQGYKLFESSLEQSMECQKTGWTGNRCYPIRFKEREECSRSRWTQDKCQSLIRQVEEEFEKYAKLLEPGNKRIRDDLVIGSIIEGSIAAGVIVKKIYDKIVTKRMPPQ